jgi:hypothetical protein
VMPNVKTGWACSLGAATLRSPMVQRLHEQLGIPRNVDSAVEAGPDVSFRASRALFLSGGGQRERNGIKV